MLHRRSTAASGAPAGVDAGARAAPHARPRGAGAPSERLGGEQPAGWPGTTAGAAREAAVEGQRAQRADLGGGAEALGRRAAQAVEGRLVADHAAGDLRSSPVCSITASASSPPPRAERRVAAAAQVEVAVQRALVSAPGRARGRVAASPRAQASAAPPTDV